MLTVNADDLRAMRAELTTTRLRAISLLDQIESRATCELDRRRALKDLRVAIGGLRFVAECLGDVLDSEGRADLVPRLRESLEVGE